METIEQLKEELEKERARAEKAEALVLAEQQKRETAEAHALAEQQQREAAEKAVKKTDFHTFLSLCHKNLYDHLTVQEDPTLSATGYFTNVDSKYYPLCLKPWAEFPSLHERCQGSLASLFKNGLVFPDAASLKAMNELFSMDEPLADENDVRIRQFIHVESCTRRVLFQYLKERKDAPPPANNETGQRDEDQGGATNENDTLPVRVYFSNMPHGILLEDGNNDSQNSDTKPAYQPTMLEAQIKDAAARGRLAGDGPPPAKRTSSLVRKLHPDQWLMRVDNDGSVIPVFVVEYKAAHKLRGATLKLALDDTTRGPLDLFAAAIREQRHNKIIQGDDRLKHRVDAEKATARVITQAFHYMVEFGLCYSYVASGEALILLYFDVEDVRTLYYHLALPQEEVGSGAALDVRRSAVALVSTMALLALDEPVLSQRWKKEAVSVLKRWPFPYDEMCLLDDSSEEENATKPTTTPQLAPRPGQEACQDDIKPQRNRQNDSDDDNDREFQPPKSQQARTSPTRRQYTTRSKGTNTSNTTNTTNRPNTTRQHKLLPYCSQACILGLRNGGSLDRHCPNVQLHPSTEAGGHTLTPMQFCNQLRMQLADDLDENCDALDRFGKFGAIGMLFRLTLQGYGYCVVAKGVQRVHAALLEQEASIYQYLYEQQGTLVPVCIGIIDLVDVYRTSFGAHVAHMMVMSYAGEPIGSKAARPLPDNIDSLKYAVWTQLQQLGVDHGDERNPNLLWNAPLQRLMCIDFERSKIITRKRKYRVETLPTSEPSSAGWETTVPSKSVSREAERLVSA